MDHTEEINELELETGTNPIKILLRFLPYWPIFAGLVAFAMLVSYTYLRFAKPVYESSASLLIKDEHQGMAAAKLFSSLNLRQSGKIIENEVEVLSSKTLMKEVVTKLNLYAPVYFDGKEAKGPAYDYCPIRIWVSDPLNMQEEDKIPFKYDPANKRIILDNQSFPLNAWVNLKWGSLKFTLNDRVRGVSPSNSYYFSLVSVKKVANNLLGQLEVLQPAKKATVVVLKMTSPIPSMSEDVLNELIDTYNADAFKAKNTQISNTLAFVENRLHYIGKELDSVESAVAKYKTEKGIVNIQQQGNGLVGDAELNGRRINDLNSQLAILDEVERYMRGGNRREVEEEAPLEPAPVSQQEQNAAPLNAVDNKELADAKERLRQINVQLAVLKDAPPIDQYYNMRIIRLESEIRYLYWNPDKRDLKAKVAAKELIIKALKKRALSGEDNVQDVEDRKLELLQAKNDLEEEIATLSNRKSPVQAPAVASQESRRVIKRSVPTREISAIPSTNGLKDPNLSSLLERYYNLQDEYEGRRQTIPENNSIMVSLRSQIQNVERSILNNVQNQRQNLEASRSNLTTRTENYNAMVAEVPGTEKTLKGISRTQGTTNEIYTFLLQKREENALLLASDISDNKKLDYADTAPFPVGPKRTMVFMIAIASAMAVGIGFVTVKKALNPVLESKAELVDLIQLPIVAEIFEAKGKAGIFANNEKNVPISEQFRQLRTSLSFMGIFPGKKNLLVTSAVPGEGKSFVAANLALSLALTEKNVLLVELDLHKAKLANLLDSTNNLGMSEYLQGRAELDAVIKPTEQCKTLFLVPAGSTPENPSELILSERMTRFFQEVDERFDYVIIKSAPVSQLTDAFVISKLTDATVFVLRQGYTPLAAIRELQSGNMFNTLGQGMVVLNGVKDKENNLEERLTQ